MTREEMEILSIHEVYEIAVHNVPARGARNPNADEQAGDLGNEETVTDIDEHWTESD